jgi:hypothetical protein
MTRAAAETMAKNSWRLPLVALLLMTFSNTMAKIPLVTLILSAVYLVLFIVGLICGIKACLAVRTHGRDKLLIPGIIGVLLNIALPSGIIAVAIPSFFTAKDRIVNDQLIEIAKKMSASAPAMIDQETRLDAVAASGAAALDIKYTLIKMNKDEVDIPAFEKTMGDSLRDKYMKDPQMEWFRTHDISISHIYNDKDGKRIAVIVTTKNIQQ